MILFSFLHLDLSKLNVERFTKELNSNIERKVSHLSAPLNTVFGTYHPNLLTPKKIRPTTNTQQNKISYQKRISDEEEKNSDREKKKLTGKKMSSLRKKSWKICLVPNLSLTSFSFSIAFMF